ncbi:hypothetical protein Bca4012_065422 [Brassica carinata]
MISYTMLVVFFKRQTNEKERTQKKIYTATRWLEKCRHASEKRELEPGDRELEPEMRDLEVCVGDGDERARRSEMEMRRAAPMEKSCVKWIN